MHQQPLVTAIVVPTAAFALACGLAQDQSESYPEEPHGFRNAENRIDMHHRLELWFDRWLKGGG